VARAKKLNQSQLWFFFGSRCHLKLSASKEQWRHAVVLGWYAHSNFSPRHNFCATILFLEGSLRAYNLWELVHADFRHCQAEQGWNITLSTWMIHFWTTMTMSNHRNTFSTPPYRLPTPLPPPKPLLWAGREKLTAFIRLHRRMKRRRLEEQKRLHRQPSYQSTHHSTCPYEH